MEALTAAASWLAVLLFIAAPARAEDALARMERMRPYLDNGILELDNNTAERGMRAIALGRKNYLFVGSEAGGKAAAIAYTLIETAKLNGVDPEAWLADTIARIPDYKITKVDDLLPWHWKPIAVRPDAYSEWVIPAASEKASASEATTRVFPVLAATPSSRRERLESAGARLRSQGMACLGQIELSPGMGLRQALRQLDGYKRSHSWGAIVWLWSDRKRLSRRGDRDAPAIREPARAIRRKIREPGVVEREVFGAEHAAPPVVHALVKKFAPPSRNSLPQWLSNAQVLYSRSAARPIEASPAQLSRAAYRSIHCGARPG